MPVSHTTFILEPAEYTGMYAASQPSVRAVSQPSPESDANNVWFTRTFKPAATFAFGTRGFSRVRYRDADHPQATGDGPRS